MKVKAVLDRMEGPFAVLLIGDEGIVVNWPAEYLPKGTEEGGIMVFELERDQECTKKRREKVASLIEKLQGKGGK